ncbi:MAG: hypothetical protein ACRDKZ_10465 [Actinomycetota bacterium]
MEGPRTTKTRAQALAATAVLAGALAVVGLTLVGAAQVPEPVPPQARRAHPSGPGAARIPTVLRPEKTSYGLAGDVEVSLEGGAPEDAIGCIEERPVRVFRLAGDSDTQVAETVTDASGRWSVEVPSSDGEHYVVVSESSFADRYGRVIRCRAAASPEVTIKLSHRRTDVPEDHGPAPVGRT